jgi:hypothetical protein
MNTDKFVGMRAWNVNTHQIGTIEYIRDGKVGIDFYGNIIKYSFPAAFAGILEFEDEDLQKEIQDVGIEASFYNFKTLYRSAINNEIEYLKLTGGKKYKIVDGEIFLPIVESICTHLIQMLICIFQMVH